MEQQELRNLQQQTERDEQEAMLQCNVGLHSFYLISLNILRLVNLMSLSPDSFCFCLNMRKFMNHDHAECFHVLLYFPAGDNDLFMFLHKVQQLKEKLLIQTEQQTRAKAEAETSQQVCQQFYMFFFFPLTV